MARSPALAKEIKAMDAIERAFAALPAKSHPRMVGWVVDNFGSEAEAEPEHQGAEAPGRNAGDGD